MKINFRYLKLNSLNPLLACGAKNIPNTKAKTATIDAPIIYGLINLENETPELINAITSVLFANFEVNHITERNKNNGNNKFAK